MELDVGEQLFFFYEIKTLLIETKLPITNSLDF